MQFLTLVLFMALGYLLRSEYLTSNDLKLKLGIGISNKMPQSIESEYHQILEKYSIYYRNLNPSRKEEFRKRLYKLLHFLAFSSAEIRIVTREMRVVIGCAIIEITFGLEKFLPERFTNVMVKPRRYMYPGYGEPFLGHIDYSRNTLFFSWPDVQSGYLIPDDALNVALHEMAHVLEVENQFSEIFQKFFDDISWDKWAKLAFEKMTTIRNNDNKFLKNYGGHNMREMFAVCVETFFEQPAEFKENLPELYQTMVNLLKQDPLLKEDPVLGRK